MVRLAGAGSVGTVRGDDGESRSCLSLSDGIVSWLAVGVDVDWDVVSD